MATRPCRADADVKRIWQLLLPDTPFPECGAQEDAGMAASESAGPLTETPADAEARPFPRTRLDRRIRRGV
jgi:hypothetical protein